VGAYREQKVEEKYEVLDAVDAKSFSHDWTTIIVCTRQKE
jgi:hypothetical protein